MFILKYLQKKLKLKTLNIKTYLKNVTIHVHTNKKFDKNQCFKIITAEKLKNVLLVTLHGVLATKEFNTKISK